MTGIILHTSGSTKDPKEVIHPWTRIENCILRSIQEIGLTQKDVVLDVFPANVIAHYTITAFPAKYAGAKLISSNFDPYGYIKLFQKYQPTYIALIPKHYEILSKTKAWDNLDMSCVRYMVTGSGIVSQEMIDAFRFRGVKTVANWYGMTEMPPPVLIGYNSNVFKNTPTDGYNVEFSDEGECIINGWRTGDIFNSDMTFQKRRDSQNGTTWKTNI